MKLLLFFVLIINLYADVDFNVPKDFPYKVIWQTSSSASNIVHTLTLYSKKGGKKVAEIRQPINEYQANNRQGSEMEIVGFYKNKNGQYFIDRLTTKGTQIAKCNACQEYNVETLQVIKGGVKSVALKAFDIENYQQYEN